MAERRPPRLLIVSILLATLLSFYSVSKRIAVESSNRSLAIATEMDTVDSLGAAAGLSPEAALQRLKVAGLNAVVLGDESIGELSGNRQLTVGVRGDRTVISNLDPTVVARVKRGLALRGYRFQETGGKIVLEAGPGSVRGTSIGLDPVQARQAREARMQIVARTINPAGASAAYVKGTLEWMRELGATMFLPAGDQVLGRRDALGATRETLDRVGMRYLSPEFAKLGGDEEMLEKDAANVVRLHSAQTAELDRLSADDALDRYEKAARERGMRVLLLRPLTLASESPIASFGSFVESVAKACQKDGLVLGVPQPSHGPGLPNHFALLIGLAVAPLVWFAVAGFVTNPLARRVGAVLLAALAVGCATKAGTQVMALLAAAAAPVAAFQVLDDVALRLKGPEWARVLQAFLLVSAISLVGGLVVAGMLNGLPYYVKADEFKGIKAAVFLPVLGIGWYAFSRLTDWRANLRSPITWGAVVLSVFLAGAMAFMLARTGNDGGVGASGGEMAMRGLLDRYAFVRPRTKEFLVGHPIMIVALGLYLRYRRTSGSPSFRSGERKGRGDGASGVPMNPETRSPQPPLSPERERGLPAGGGWIALLLLLGAVGQTSVVNTLCHLHIPVALSLARIAIGLALGAAFGFVAWAVVVRVAPTMAHAANDGAQ